MATGKMAGLLEHGANILTIGTCAFACWMLWSIYQNGGLADAGARTVEDENEILALPGHDFTRFRATIVVGLSSTCKYCTQALPYLQSLSTSPVVLDKHIPLVAVGVETEESLRTYLEMHGLQVQRVYTVSPELSLVRQTPSLALVDSAGRVRRFWRGLISKRRLEEITGA